jgi:Methyltransferase domain
MSSDNSGTRASAPQEPSTASTADVADGSTLGNFAEILLPCLDAISARSVIEIGAYHGDFTRVLLDWAAAAGADVTAIDTEPQPRLRGLAREHPELNLVVDRSVDALPRLREMDAVIIDGDHNYYTVSEELRLVSAHANGSLLPLMFFHDVCWPYGRRDGYYEPEAIPDEHRHRLAREDVLLVPPTPFSRLPRPAQHEGGPKNGVLTAIEDFVDTSDEPLRLAVVPAFFGLGILWSKEAPWADAVEEVVAPWDSNPMLERLETERIANLVDRSRIERHEVLVKALLNSRAFTLAEYLSRIRQGGEAVVTREQLKRELETSWRQSALPQPLSPRRT